MTATTTKPVHPKFSRREDHDAYWRARYYETNGTTEVESLIGMGVPEELAKAITQGNHASPDGVNQPSDADQPLETTITPDQPANEISIALPPSLITIVVFLLGLYNFGARSLRTLWNMLALGMLVIVIVMFISIMTA